MIKFPVTLFEDKNDGYAVYRVYDYDNNLLFNLNNCARWQSAKDLEKAKELGNFIVKAMNDAGVKRDS